MHRTSYMKRIMKSGPCFSEYIFCLSLNLLIAHGEGQIVHRANNLLGDYVKYRAPCSSHDIKELCVVTIICKIGEIPLNVTESWGKAEARGHCINPQQFHVPTAQRAMFVSLQGVFIYWKAVMQNSSSLQGPPLRYGAFGWGPLGDMQSTTTQSLVCQLKKGGFLKCYGLCQKDDTSQ